MPFTVTVTTIGGAAGRVITGDGNLTDLVTALAADGWTISGRTVTVAPGSALRFRIDGALTETRNGIWTVRITAGFVCWSGIGSTTILGARTASGIRTSVVNITYTASARAAGADPFNAREYDCFAGGGRFRHYAGVMSYEYSGTRSDMDIFSGATEVLLDDVDYQYHIGTNAGYTHFLTGPNVTTTQNARFTFPTRMMEASRLAPTVRPFSVDTGLRLLIPAADTVWTVQKPAYPYIDMYQTLSIATAIINVYDPATDYFTWEPSGNYGLNLATMRVYRTLSATFKTPLGVNIGTPDPKLVAIPPTGSPVTSTLVAGAATYEALQSTRASGANYLADGTGFTAFGNFNFYLVAYGAAAQYLDVNPRTAYSGTDGIPWNAVGSVSPLCVTAYASDETAGFSFDTGTNTLTITAARTTAQVAEYLFKHAYDNADSAYWRSHLHTPAVVDGSFINFADLNIVVGSGGVLSGQAAKTTGVISTTGTGTISALYQDTNGASSKLILTLPLADMAVCVHDDLGAEVECGVRNGTYTLIIPPGASGTWSWAVNKQGYVFAVGTFTPGSGGEFSASPSCPQVLTALGEPMYQATSSALVSVTFSGGFPRIDIGDGTPPLQAIYDACEDAIYTDEGIAWIINGGDGVSIFESSAGNFLFMTGGWRIRRRDSGDANATVPAFCQSVDGVVVDDVNGSVAFQTSDNPTTIAAAVWSHLSGALIAAGVPAIQALVEADEVHTGTTVQKRQRGTSTVLLEKNWTGQPLVNFRAVQP